MARVVIGLMAILSISACESRPEPRGTQVIDSAGIQVVTTHTPLEEWPIAWRVAPHPDHVVGAAEADDVELLGVTDARLTPSGTLVVASAGLDEVVAIDSVTVPGLYGRSRPIGQRGEGPGEYTEVHGLALCSAGDSLAVFERNRITIYHASGDLGRTTTLPREGESFRISGLSESCSEVLVQGGDAAVPAPATVGAVRLTLGWRNPSDSGGAAADVAGSLPAFHALNQTVMGGNILIRVPWSPETKWASRDQTVTIGTSSEPEVRIYERDRLVKVVRWRDDLEPVTRQERRRYEAVRDRLIESVRPLRNVMVPLAEYSAIPNVQPVFASLLMDDRGNLWVREYPSWFHGRPDLFDRGGPLWQGEIRRSDDWEQWKIFDPDGIPLGRVATPPGFSVTAVENDHVVAVGVDSHDVEYVAVFRLMQATPVSPPESMP